MTDHLAGDDAGARESATDSGRGAERVADAPSANGHRAHARSGVPETPRPSAVMPADRHER